MFPWARASDTGAWSRTCRRCLRRERHRKPRKTPVRPAIQTGINEARNGDAGSQERELGYPAMSENPEMGHPVLERGNLCRSEEHTSELQSLRHLVCRLLLE